MISGTVTDLSGRTLSGQTVEAFLISIAHAQPLIVGLNCALGPDEMEPLHRRAGAHFAVLHERLSERRICRIRFRETGFPETRRNFAPKVARWAENGWLNMVGGCCGTTPEHIRESLQRPVRELSRRAN